MRNRGAKMIVKIITARAAILPTVVATVIMMVLPVGAANGAKWAITNTRKSSAERRARCFRAMIALSAKHSGTQ